MGCTICDVAAKNYMYLLDNNTVNEEKSSKTRTN